MWVVLCIGSVGLVIVLINPVYNKWRTSPTITTVDSTSFPIWNIYFPVKDEKNPISTFVEKFTAAAAAANFSAKHL